MPESQREEIYRLIEEIRALSKDAGNFGPSPSSMTLEIAEKIHRLGSLCRAYGAREKANFRQRELARTGAVPRAEIVDEDLEDRLHEALMCAERLRSCPVSQVAACREQLHGCLESAGVAAADPALRAEAGVSRHLRPRTRETLDMRRADALERARVEAERDRAAGQAQQALAERDRVLGLVVAAAKGDPAAAAQLASLARALG